MNEFMAKTNNNIFGAVTVINGDDSIYLNHKINSKNRLNVCNHQIYASNQFSIGIIHSNIHIFPIQNYFLPHIKQQSAQCSLKFQNITIYHVRIKLFINVHCSMFIFMFLFLFIVKMHCISIKNRKFLTTQIPQIEDFTKKFCFCFFFCC